VAAVAARAEQEEILVTPAPEVKVVTGRTFGGVHWLAVAVAAGA